MNSNLLSIKNINYKILLLVIFLVIIFSVWVSFNFDSLNFGYLLYFTVFVVIGFAVQLLGTAYSLITVVILLNFGLEPLLASVIVHTVSIFTSFSSSVSHWKMGNVNKKLAKGLLVPGILGVLLGVVLMSFMDGKWLKPFITLYLLVMGLRIVQKSAQKVVKKSKIKGLKPLALMSGFLDSIGGGGWGAILATTLLSKGKTPRYTLGTVNFTKFFITLSASLAFFTFAHISSEGFLIILALILGGIPASYISAYLASRLPAKILMFWVGIVIVILSLASFISIVF